MAAPSPQNMTPAWGAQRRLPARQQVEPSASAVTRERLRLAKLNFCSVGLQNTLLLC